MGDAGGAMSDAIVTYAATGSVATITFDDGKANALSSEMMNQLQAALTRANGEAKAIVLSGRPGRFSAGFDLKVMMSGPKAAKELVAQGAELLMKLYELPLPVVAACTGHAMAGGALMLLASDTRIGALGDFKIGLNETAIGMTLPILAQELARDRLEPCHLTSATIQARIYDPTGAVEAGFLDRAVAPAELPDASMQVAALLAKLPGKAYAATKRRLRAKTIAHIRDTLQSDLDELVPPVA
jgi:enoyl-CoA hydratase